MIEQGIYERLTTDSGLLALLAKQPDASPCVFWVLQAKGTGKPSIVITRVTTRDVYSASGSSNLRFASFQFDSYDKQPGGGYYGARAVADAVRNLFKNYKGTLPDLAGSPPDGTVVQGCVVTRDNDMGFESGASGFIFRTLLEITFAYEG